MQCMAQEGSEASVASSPPAPPPPSSSATTAASWWRDMHGHPYAAAAAAAACSWPPPAPAPSSAAAAAPRWPPMAQAATHHRPHHPHHRTSSSSGGAEDDLSDSHAIITSFTNASTNHSSLSMDSSSEAAAAAAAAAAAESHLIWNQVLMGAGGEVGRSMPAVHDAHDDSENFLELLNSRTLAPELFAEPPACDYLKKMEYSGAGGGGGGWPDHQFTAAALVEKHMSSAAGYGGALAHHHHHHHASAGGAPERLTANLSDLVSNWSIAPPNPCLGDAHGHHCVGSAPCDNPAVAAAMGGSKQAGGFLDSGGNVVKHEMSGAMLQEASGNSSTSGQDFLRPMELAAGAGGYSSMLGLNSRMYGGGVNAAMDVPWGSNNAGAARSLSDLISFGGALDKPAAPQSSAPADYKKQQQGQQEISSPAKTSSSGGKEGKKKRSEEQGGPEGNTKKSKHEATSSLKSQVPKVKLGDKITALQQIVSPFGKTDTASVLYEAINYIKWLHEQLQVINLPKQFILLFLLNVKYDQLISIILQRQGPIYIMWLFFQHSA
ncbi:hypothetical protein ABZP36_002551 [Zizania latifolia]